MTKMRRKFLVPAIATAIALGLFAFQALPALACGGLIAPHRDVHLARATTLVARHNGTEHYPTSFTHPGNAPNVGWVVPLPAVPLNVEEGGAWTLQRLERETHPVVQDQVRFAAAAATANSAQVLEQVKIEALNITVLRGSGEEVLNWARSNNFCLNDETRNHLLTYANASPIFMAAKFDTTAARARHQLQGDGTPILITMRTAHIWVPLEVLAIDGQQVQADLYLLTDEPVNTSDFGALVGQSPVGTQVPGAPGIQISFQEKMNPTLYHDLPPDRNMGWVWPSSWVTYLTLDAPASAVTYDLGVSSTGVLRLAPFGTPPMAVVDGQVSHEPPAWLPMLPSGTPQAVLIALVLLSLGSGLALIFLARRRSKLNV